MSYHHKSGAQKRREKAMRAEGVKGQNTHGFAGVETRDTLMSASGPIRKAWGVGGGGGGGGGGGVLSTLGPTRKAGRGEGGGAARFWPDTKSGGGGGLFSRRGGGTFI